VTSLIESPPSASPRFLTKSPLGCLSLGPEVAELAASAGLVPDPWQRDVLDGALEERGDGKWAHFEVDVIVSRQNGKNGGILAPRQLAGLFLFGERTQTHTAHRLDTCLEHFRFMRDLVNGCQEFRRLVKKIPEANGSESIELVTGQRLLFKARSKQSGRGFTGDTVYYDEAMRIAELGDMLPIMSARPNPQVWFTSSAPLPRAESDILRSICKKGRRGSRRVFYIEWSCPEDADLDDRANWWAANPEMGGRLTEEFTENERNTLTDEEFGRERLGIFQEDVGEFVLSADDWQATCAKKMTLSDPVTLAVDVTPDRSYAAIGAAGSTSKSDGVELIDHRRRADWIVPRVIEIAGKHEITGVVVDGGSAAASLIGELQDAGIEVFVASVSDHRQACGIFYDAVVSHDLTHLDDPPLEAAVAGATKRVSGDAWLWDRRHVDICPLVAVTLALWGHRNPGEQDPDMAPPEVVVL
jgi:phage terminase large subunit-like protein